MLVGDCSKISIHKVGHSLIYQSNPFRTLTLNNILITPSVIKILIYVRCFTRDNKCSIEFDAFGIFVKDYRTKQTLLRCDNTGVLHLVTTTSPQVFHTIAPSLWN